LDESFIEFAAEESILAMLRANPLPNVILLKSLSKSLGVPGIRLGYLYSHNAGFMAYVKQNLPIWNMNALSEYFLEIILKHRDSLHDSFRQTISDREQFASMILTLPIVEKVYPSGANFILLSLNCTRAACGTLVESMLLRHKIYIKDASNRFRGQTASLRRRERRQNK